MLLPGDACSFLHEEHAEALVLELGRVAGVDGDGCAVHVQLTHHGDVALQLRAERGRAECNQTQADESQWYTTVVLGTWP